MQRPCTSAPAPIPSLGLPSGGQPGRQGPGERLGLLHVGAQHSLSLMPQEQSPNASLSELHEPGGLGLLRCTGGVLAQGRERDKPTPQAAKELPSSPAASFPRQARSSQRLRHGFKRDAQQVSLAPSPSSSEPPCPASPLSLQMLLAADEGPTDPCSKRHTFWTGWV